MMLLIKWLPPSVRRRINRTIKGHYLRLRELEDKSLPKHNLTQLHIRHLKPLLNREELLEHLPKGGIIAEIGVAEGEFSQKIINACAPARFHLIDSWASERYSIVLKSKVEKQFEEQISKGQVAILLHDSVKAAHSFPDYYFDWIYLDSDHSYEHTKQELEAYRLKMKKDGIIVGHDFIQGNWVSGVRYGVIEAVYEFCVRYKWELVYVTMDFNEYPSFAIRQVHELV